MATPGTIDVFAEQPEANVFVDVYTHNLRIADLDSIIIRFHLKKTGNKPDKVKR